jgi:hydrogenase large subunit
MAVGARPPTNARLVRNILLGVALVADHVTAFYQRQAFDWLDLSAALDADPSAATEVAVALAGATSDAVPHDAAYFQSVRDRLGAVLRSDQPGIFASRLWGHPAYRLSPAQDLVLAAHYLEALDWRRHVLQVQTYLGGKTVHPQTWAIGGMALVPPWGGPARPMPGEHLWSIERETPQALSSSGLAAIAALVDEARSFVDQVSVPDAQAIGQAYPDWAGIGAGIGHFLSFGEFPEDDADTPTLLAARGRVMDRDVNDLIAVDQAGVTESLAHAWYADGGSAAPRHPSEGLTEPLYSGPPIPFSSLASADRYSWAKAPRYEGDPMEVGPLARLAVAAAAAVTPTPTAPATGPTAMSSAFGSLGAAATPFGTLGRIVGRALEAQVVAGRLAGWLESLRSNLASGDLAVIDLAAWDPASWPASAEGWSIGESARGSVGHWLAISNRRIERYQVVDASTWNASPRNESGRRGALEEALVGTPVSDVDRPLEVLRVVHAFDPCPMCGVH